MVQMFTLDTTLTFLGLIIKVSIFLLIFLTGYGIGRYVQASTEQVQLVSILERALTMIRGLKTSVKDLKSDVTVVKSELTLRSLCPECSKLHVLGDSHKN